MPRKAKVSREQILAMARRQLDDGGTEGLSMRSLGKALGVEAMSLYKYVGKKEELLAELREQLFRSIELAPVGFRPADTWRRDLEELSGCIYRALSARPGARALLLNDSIGVWNASSLPVGEAMMRYLTHPIPQVLDRAYAFHSLFSFIVGQAIFGAPRLIKWSEQSPEDFPEIARAAETLDSRNPEVEFELGLRSLLDSIEQRSVF